VVPLNLLEFAQLPAHIIAKIGIGYGSTRGHNLLYKNSCSIILCELNLHF